MKQKAVAKAIRLLVSGAATAGLAMTVTSIPMAAQAQTAVGSGDNAKGPAKEAAKETAKEAAKDVTVLPAVTVTGQTPENSNNASTGIARMPGTVRETPRVINVVPQEIIEQQRATSLEQVLKNVPGITLSTGEGNGGQSGDQFRIRGLSAKGDIYVDGLRDFGAYRRDSFNTESVQVIKGPSGETFGVGNVGGIINQTSKRAHLGTTTSIDQSVGSESTYRTTVDSNIQLNDTSAVRINGMFQDGNTPDRDHVRDDRKGFAVDFGTGLGTSTEWHLNYSYLHSNGVPDYGQPMAVGADGIARPLLEYGVPGISSSTSYVRSTDRDKSSVHMVTSGFTKQLDNGITINNDTRVSVYERDFAATNPAGVTYANLQRLLAGGNVPLSYGAGGGMTYLQRGWAVQNVLSAKGEFQTGGFRHRAMVGLDMNYQDDDRDLGTWTGRVNNQTVVNPAFQMTPGASVAYGATTRSASSSNVGVFANDRFWLNDQFSLLGSLRWDYFESKYSTNASSVGGKADSKKLSPSIAAMWEPTQNAMFYTSFSRTYRPVGTDIALAVGGVQSEVPGAASGEPERADTVEVGTKLDFLNKRLGFTAALFQTKKDNAYTVDPVTGDITDGFADSGEGRRIRGLELGLSGRITTNWAANIAYAYLDGEVTHSSTATSIGNTAPGVSRHNVVLWTSYDIPQTVIPLPGRFTVGGGLQYASAYWADSANTGRMPENFSVDAMIAYRQGKYRISLNGYNLTDHLNYQSSFNASRAVPGSRRTFMLNVGMTF
ncbi:TonB-dependent siderophore receptor [Cupriavidus respiraculi]|uniref:TonB-dependent receptor BfrD n=1 Tax=Cupriavidus respiraculi TaxID=195930 RepID=A0ABN7Y5A4_9BURK|nr:TonB-dependent siderophore receptor [Cupriavidus respiraculi]CAG9167022.1 putative TonB-dependent receptor BfrD [Cupriavidus respiraculi]